MNVICKDVKCQMNDIVCEPIVNNRIKRCHLDKRKHMNSNDLLCDDISFGFIYNYSKSHVETILYQHLSNIEFTDYIH